MSASAALLTFVVSSGMAAPGTNLPPNQFANSCFTQASVASHFVIAQAFPNLIEKGALGMPKALSSVHCTFAPLKGGAV